MLKGGIILCATFEGCYNLYQIVSGKDTKDVYPSFTRTHGQICKIYAEDTHAYSLSDHK